MKHIGRLLLFATSLVFPVVSWAAEQPLPTNTVPLGEGVMTPERFKEIAGTPGDSVPLVPQVAVVPFWADATASNVMTYVSSGKMYTEELSVTAKTVGGKYVVFTVRSKSYNQAANSLLAYDQKSAALKVYGLYGDGHGGETVTEGTTVYDSAKKTYTITSTYGDGFKEITSGFDTSTEDSAETAVYQNGVLFMTRETITRPVVSPK